MEDIKEILKDLRRLEIYTNKLVEEQMGGVYHSVFKGKGIEFYEVREWQEGDDIRTIDWNVTARMGYPYIKTYLEERELNVYLLIDLSASQNWGSSEKSKRTVATQISALIGFSAIKNNDNVGLILFTNKIEKHIPPKKGKDHIMHILREILSLKPKNKETNIKNCLDYFGRISPKKSIVFLISDFLDKNFEKPLKILSKKHDLISIQILDEREIKPNFNFFIEGEDIEKGETFYLDFQSKKVLDFYEKKLRDFQEKLEKFFQSAQIDFLKIYTKDEPFKVLDSFFKLRRKRLRGVL